MVKPLALLINPPIYDFAAYDLWVKPLGLLYLAGILKDIGFDIYLIDYLDRNNNLVPFLGSNIYGCGHYYSQEIHKPDIFSKIPRKYKRYGIPEESAKGILKDCYPPDIVFVTSGMTYWYPGVIEVIKDVKDIFPKVPVVLGGIYATLCYEHAKRFTGANFIIQGNSFSPLKDILKELRFDFDENLIPEGFSEFPPPYYEIYNNIEYVVIRMSQGCPFRCSYCAIKRLSNDRFEFKSPDKVADEIISLYIKRGIRNFAFYDDALLFNSDNYFIPFMQNILKANIKAYFHSPNGLHARYINFEVADLMKKVGFVMPRLSLETSIYNKQIETGGKVTNKDFIEAVKNLKKAGYKEGEYGCYIMIGWYNVDFSDIEESIRFVHSYGAKVFLAEYSPIPSTKEWDSIKDILPSSDPLWHNNSIFPLFPLSDWDKFQRLKHLAISLNKCFT